MLLLTSLPPELIHHICSHLSTQDLTSLSETCVKMYTQATDPVLWENSFQLVPSYLVNEDPELFMKILNLKRFTRMRKIFLELSPSLGNELISMLFNSLMHKKNLEAVYFGECSLLSVPSDILSSFLKGIASVTFDFGTKVNDEQMQSFFNSLEEGSKVKSMYLEELNLTSIDPNTFAKAVNSLKEFSSYYIDYTDEQVNRMFEEMAEDTNLEQLVFHHKHVHYVDAQVLAKAFNNLTDLTVNLSDLPFSNDQVGEIFRQMSQKSKLEKLEVLTYSYPDLWDFSFIPPKVLAEAVKNLHELYMTDIVFSTYQICLMLEAFAKIDRKVILDLGCCDISELSLELLEEVVEKLEPNGFSRKLRYRILQLCEESVKQLKCKLNEVDIEHREVIEEIRTVRKEGKLMRMAALKSKGFTFLLQPGVSKFYQKTKYSSRCSFLKYSRYLRNPTFWRTLKLKKHARDCKMIRNIMLVI